MEEFKKSLKINLRKSFLIYKNYKILIINRKN